MADVVTGGVRLFVTEEGSGPPFIVLHGGLGFDHAYMKHSFGPLADVMRLIYFDQRGNGRSDRVPLDTINIPQLAEDVDGLRTELGLDRVGLIGHSYGGFVALEYATRHPDRVSHLICNDTSPGVFEPTEAELAERADPSWITPAVERAMGLLSGGMPSTAEEMRAMLPEFVPIYLRSHGPEILAPILAESMLDPVVAAASMQALAGWSVADKLGVITCPTLVLCGRYDLMTTPECSKRLSTAIPDAELVWFEDSGHFPEIEEPERFHEAVREWVVRHP